MWSSGLRKMPNLNAQDIADIIPIGLFACLAHCGSVLAAAVGAVSFAQIVKACEPVFAAVVGVLIAPIDIKPKLAYAMLVPIVCGVGLACVKPGVGISLNVTAFMYASLANASAALKGKLGTSVTHDLKSNAEKNMDATNVYAVTNIISFICTIPFVVINELPHLADTWAAAREESSAEAILTNIFLSGLCFYFYNEFAFSFTAHVGAVTSSVLNTAKRVIIIMVSAIVFSEELTLNATIGSVIAIGGTLAYSIYSKQPKEKTS